jgi:hypothetical protein
LIEKLTRPIPLSSQTTALNTSSRPAGRGSDLTYQLMGVFFNVVPALLAVHLLRRDHRERSGSSAWTRRGLGAAPGSTSAPARFSRP